MIAAQGWKDSVVLSTTTTWLFSVSHIHLLLFVLLFIILADICWAALGTVSWRWERVRMTLANWKEHERGGDNGGQVL